MSLLLQLRLMGIKSKIAMQQNLKQEYLDSGITVYEKNKSTIQAFITNT